ncbi:arad-like aldolase/epimerase [Calocera viscosa TUFC12733]|uniref:Arad-like aldolase/epimerase n=1 Tax=Calocera viscosa (strain TUFC12733) TaxID=1330018 RepID=A0A167GR58_CALVF|nr:arad-like aldolase/epimerase [Calocera viscosa TUFC12733]
MSPIATVDTATLPHPDNGIKKTTDKELTPMDRAVRGNKQGALSLEDINDFDGDVHEQRKVLKEHLAGAFQFWGKKGYGEGSAGPITAMDPVQPDHYWINPFGVHFSDITASKLVLVGPNGYVAEGGAQLPINEAGFLIHSAVHRARPDAVAVAHCHSPYGKAWSVFGMPIDTLTQDACLFFENLVVYNNFGGIVLAAEEGNRIARALGPTAKAGILQNHGLMTVGTTIFECLYYFEFLERQCQVQLLVEAAVSDGLQKTFVRDEDARNTARTTQYWENPHRAMLTEYIRLVAEDPSFLS